MWDVGFPSSEPPGPTALIWHPLVLCFLSIFPFFILPFLVNYSWSTNGIRIGSLICCIHHLKCYILGPNF
jgi:hypothetical protein